MNTHMIIISAIALSIMPFSTVQAQQLQVQRTDLIKSDISVSGKEVVQVRVDFAPGVFAVSHRHPGEEVAYVIEGMLEYELEGQKPVTLRAGQSLFIPAGTPHSARNVGDAKASELATYIVSKGVALVELVK
ncbi:quercetin dioxygenase-like cupin family protein [Rhizobium herbae]|uniref:Quercetin dioxygenase-like cupin family protein n=2 Tax=Rhizobium herbae TaxID=508661 RepID=A0ABS4EWD3_9HYPH|nr:quercetin dioxygenase-like cupin family protein [Rhizobium herbae]